jgi:seryl-tRNA synthetase
LNTIEKINAPKNIANKEINNFFSQHETNEANEIIKKMTKLKSKMIENEQLSKKLKDEIDVLLLSLPNLPDDSVPNGQNENDNKIIKK